MNDPRIRQAWALALLSIPAAFMGLMAGAAPGAFVGGMLEQLEWVDMMGWGVVIGALFGGVIGVPLAQAALGFLWAKRCGRVRWVPTVAMLLVSAISVALALVVNNYFTYTPFAFPLALLVFAATLGAMFLIGWLTPPLNRNPGVPPPARP